MAQSSLPQPGNKNITVAYLDAGPYTGDQWATLFRVLFSGDQEATQGVFKDVWNELLPNHPAALNVTIATGAGICNGHVFFNDTSGVSITVDAGAGRSDALCMVENNSNTPLAPGAVYNTVGGANIPPYSCRLAVVKNIGVNFSQLTNLYMVQLATFTTNATNITGFTDVRDFCEFSTTVTPAMIEDRTRWFMVSVSSGYVYSAGPIIPRTSATGVELDAATASSEVHASFVVPKDYVSGLTVQGVINIASGGSGNARVKLETYHGACGENWNTWFDITPWTLVGVTGLHNECILSTSITNVDANDIVHMTFARSSVDPTDTAGDAYFAGFLVSYTADS